MSENSTNKKKRSGSPRPLPLATIRATGSTAADTIVVVVGTKRRMIPGGRPTTQTWEIITPLPILILVFQYLDQDGLMTASTVSKQWHQIIDSNPGMAQHRIIPVLKISASPNTGDKGRTLRLMAWLDANLHKLQRYRVLQLLDVNKFNREETRKHFNGFSWMELDGIVSFDVSSPFKLSSVNCCVLHRLSSRLPNLRELHMSNIAVCERDNILDKFSTHCPQLEKITWNNIDRDCNMHSKGWDRANKATNLREIIMDGSVFIWGGSRVSSIDKMSDLENHPRVFLFCRLESPVLERISIRRAKFGAGYWNNSQRCETIPQNALIKFIRNAPRSLRWFRSDLSKDNIEMLRLERPGIEFLN